MRFRFRTHDLAVELYHACQKVNAPHHLKDQLMRASSSVALNLAEGRGRISKADQRRFFRIAFGSLRETQSILQLLKLEGSRTYSLADRTAASCYKLINH